MKRIFTLIAACAICFFSAAQDLNFSQFYEQPLLRNPALAGIFDCNLRVKTVFRNQWQSVTVPYRTAGISAEMKIAGHGDMWHTFGLQIMYDEAGDSRLRRIMVLPAYSIHLEIAPDNYLSMGFMGGPVSSQFDVSRLTWDDQFINGQYSATNPTSQVLTNSNRTYLELAAGIIFSRPVFDQGDLYAGVSLFHANRPVVFHSGSNDNRLDRKVGFNAGLTFPSGGRDAFTLYSDVFLQGAQHQYLMGAFYTFSLADEYYDDQNKSSLHFGSAYRWNDALIPVVKLDLGQFSIGMSYDVNISKLKTASQSRGGFELTLSYRNCAVGSGHNGLPCPTFGKNY